MYRKRYRYTYLLITVLVWRYLICFGFAGCNHKECSCFLGWLFTDCLLAAALSTRSWFLGFCLLLLLLRTVAVVVVCLRLARINNWHFQWLRIARSRNRCWCWLRRQRRCCCRHRHCCCRCRRRRRRLTASCPWHINSTVGTTFASRRSCCSDTCLLLLSANE